MRLGLAIAIIKHAGRIDEAQAPRSKTIQIQTSRGPIHKKGKSLTTFSGYCKFYHTAISTTSDLHMRNRYYKISCPVVSECSMLDISCHRLLCSTLQLTDTVKTRFKNAELVTFAFVWMSFHLASSKSDGDERSMLMIC